MRRYILSILALFTISTCFSQTWTENISCIIYSHCTSCHNPDGIGPFSLASYEEVATPSMLEWIEEVIEEKEMPPWPPSSGVNDFMDDRSLSNDEIVLITHWIELGAPFGPADSLMPPPTYSFEGIEDPDLVVRMPEFTVPALSGDDMVRCFPEISGLEEDKFITAVEVVPGNRQAVHHAIIFADTAETSLLNDAAEPGPGYECQGDIGSSTAEAFIGYAPGAELLELPPGMGVPLSASSKIVSSIHYPVTASGLVDSLKVNFKFSDDTTLRPVETQSILSHLNDLIGVPNLFVPAGEIVTFYQKQSLDTSITVLRIFPHAHFICTYLYCYALLPSGDSIPIVEIPNWDQHWQGFYSYKTPIVLPAGTELRSIGIYNNTLSNPHLPDTIPYDVHAGSNSTDEMMIFAFTATPYQDGDSSLVFDTTSHYAHHNDCNPYNLSPVSIEEELGYVSVKAYPNPATEQIKLMLFRVDSQEALRFELRDMSGKIAFSTLVFEGANTLQLPPALASGLYSYTLLKQNGNAYSTTEKLLVVRGN